MIGHTSAEGVQHQK